MAHLFWMRLSEERQSGGTKSGGKAVRRLADTMYLKASICGWEELKRDYLTRLYYEKVL